ncbi:MAG: transcription termination factor Rho, partial [Atopobiaceae bacterium]|nr:transcription termination factor Rho [Atopobiaceae bacterium]
MAENAVETQEALPIMVEQVAPEEAPAKATRRRRASSDAAADAPAEAPAAEPAAGGEAEAAAQPKRRRGRPRKTADEGAGQTSDAAQAPQAPQEEGSTSEQLAAQDAVDQKPAEGEPKVRRRRSRARKDANEPADIDEMTKMTQQATVASAQIIEPPAATLAEADARLGQEQSQADAQPRRRHRGSQGNQQAQPSQQGSKAQGNQQPGQGKRNQNKRRNRRGQDTAAEPTLTLEELEAMKVAELRSKAAELGVDYVGMRKKELVEGVYHAAALAEGFRPVTGVLEMQSDGYAFLRTGNYMPGEQDAFVHQQIIRNYGLRPGDKIVGQVAPSRTGNKYPPLHRIDTVNGRAPEGLKERPRFRDLTPIYPDERLVMEHGKDSTTGRAIDLVAPIGKGQRGRLVSAPKAGKTTVLKRICQSIAANNPEVHLFCLLVDERPEEVTDMERSIRGEVVASTFDMPADNHTAVAELVIEHAKRLVEQGEDVVVVLDSITRLARAYNLAAPASGRILSGGVDSAALYPPKKFLGAARNIENGGSLTILASALVDTGSKMDEVIFVEFKGTGNMELKLDRDLADKRIFPAIDPVASGTRNEDLLIDAELQPFVWGIRRVLANMNSVERAATALVKGLKATNTNQEFLIRSAKKAQQSG